MPGQVKGEALAEEAVLDGAIERHLTRLAVERGYSAHTLAAYRRELIVLNQARCGLPAERRDWADVQETDIRRWVAAAAREGLSATSLGRRLSVWRGFFDQLAHDGVLACNPVRAVRAPKRPKRLPKALPVDQAVQLVSALDGGEALGDETFLQLRDQAMAELLYSSGLRLSELTALDHAWVDDKARAYRSVAWFDRGAAEVQVFGKGRKRRTVPVGRAALAALDAWLPVRHARLVAEGVSEEPALFISQQGRRLGNRSVQLRLARLAVTQGLPSHVHPHVLRHSFASHVLQSSGDLRAVQELLGHASISSTQIYTALDFQHLASVYDAAHPRAKRRP
ncbi:MAG: tyrosine recombinase XerC [Lautropia sp.]|nr:tyrosine recombinase XerC [Lautropia sp.]